MISIIICARKKEISPELKENIGATIGIPYEVVWIDNSENKHSIFTAYNEGVSRSRHELLVFMHDDVLYHTQDWGQKVIDHFRDEKVGAIGVAGTPYLSYTPGGWWSSGVGYLHLLQSDNRDSEPFLQNFFPASNTAEVVALDGVWFCIRKNIFITVRFDEDTFKGFHFYDVDTTLQVYCAGYKLLCIKDVLIHHLSMGMLDGKWVENALLFNNKWKSQLPISVRPYTLKEQCHIEYRVLNELMSKQAENGEKNTYIYWSGLKRLLGFKRGLLYIKTPVWGTRLFLKYLRSK
jgi:hypothetical protein